MKPALNSTVTAQMRIDEALNILEDLRIRMQEHPFGDLTPAALKEHIRWQVLLADAIKVLEEGW